MINLPHQEPIRFVKELIKKDINLATVTCSFPFPPTLSMICEASAQATAVFGNGDIKIGFLVSLKNVEQLEEFSKNEYLIDIEEFFNFGSMTEYKFELKDDSKVYAKGSLTIALQD